MPIKYMGQCSEHKASFVPNICSEVELFRTYKVPRLALDDCFRQIYFHIVFVAKEKWKIIQIVLII